MQVQGSTHHHDPAVTAVIRSTDSTHIFVFDVVGEGNCGLARMGPGFGADFQFPVHHDPFGGQFQIFIVRKAQFAVDRQTAQRRRSDIEDDVHVLINGDTASLPGTFLSGQVAGSDQRFALAVEVFCCALRTAYPPRPKKAGTSNERNKRERFRIVKSP